MEPVIAKVILIRELRFWLGDAVQSYDSLIDGKIYYCISGSGTLTIDGDPVELRPGRYVLVSPDAKRHPGAGPDGMSFLCVGGVPGGVYEPWAPPED